MVTLTSLHEKWKFHVFCGNSTSREMEVQWKPTPRTRSRSYLGVYFCNVYEYTFVTSIRYDRDRDRGSGFHRTSIFRGVEFPQKHGTSIFALAAAASPGTYGSLEPCTTAHFHPFLAQPHPTPHNIHISCTPRLRLRWGSDFLHAFLQVGERSQRLLRWQPMASSLRTELS
jgi:hypothetical protein